jgi:hypothetical protein
VEQQEIKKMGKKGKAMRHYAQELARWIDPALCF